LLNPGEKFEKIHNTWTNVENKTGDDDAMIQELKEWTNRQTTEEARHRRIPGADSCLTSENQTNSSLLRQTNKADSFKENEGTTNPGPSTRASCPVLAPHRSSAAMPVPKPVFEPTYPLYNYADNIPRPNVIYIKEEEQANEMVASLNGQVSRSRLILTPQYELSIYPVPLGLTSNGLLFQKESVVAKRERSLLFNFATPTSSFSFKSVK
jgi:hypothetical protein